jgi:hypothetical protein
MRDRPTEIDFDFDKFAIPDGDYFRISEPFAGGVLSFVGDKYVLFFAHEIHEPKPSSGLAVFPAPIEVSGTAEAIVQRTGEMKIFAEKCLYRGAILVDISLINFTGD